MHGFVTYKDRQLINYWLSFSYPSCHHLCWWKGVRIFLIKFQVYHTNTVPVSLHVTNLSEASILNQENSSQEYFLHINCQERERLTEQWWACSLCVFENRWDHLCCPLYLMPRLCVWKSPLASIVYLCKNHRWTLVRNATCVQKTAPKFT